MAKYLVTLDVFFMDYLEVEAKNKKEAGEKAIDASNWNGNAELTVFEVVKERA